MLKIIQWSANTVPKRIITMNANITLNVISPETQNNSSQTKSNLTKNKHQTWVERAIMMMVNKLLIWGNFLWGGKVKYN
jgi:hypothetical protein